ncbi:MAG: serine hydrolase domain-containing protein [Blastocatellia bacterium]
MAAFSQMPEREKIVAGAERAFEKAAKINEMPAPGCAVGVSLNGESVFEGAFGLAEMEFGIRNTEQTIFESGSIAKQFTAAAIILLQQDGKLSIDDPVRRYIPELLDYGKPLTIRHMLNHTAGLRDWGSVMAITGIERFDRVVTNDIAFDIIIRQKHLDFTPGTEFSYSNSGYQLAPFIVERVSKQKFSDFVAERIFKPLGMTKSSWRDNYRRLVPQRAQAYSRSGSKAPWILNMPISNVVGSAGMLTTVGDLLKWNASLDAKTFGAPFVHALETPGVLTEGRRTHYALGVEVGKHQGLREVAHEGQTAGYQTYLARFPEKRLSVAVLCNGRTPVAVDVVDGIVEEILGPFPEAAKDIAVVPEAELKRHVGMWKNEATRVTHQITVEKGELKVDGDVLTPSKDGSFTLDDTRLTFKGGSPARAEVLDSAGATVRLTKVPEWKPTRAEMVAFAGVWRSDEAQATMKFALEGDKAFLVFSPVSKLEMKPTLKDHFSGGIYVVWFDRNNARTITKMHIGRHRLRDIVFERVRK